MAGARGRIADFWDELTAAWLAGEDPLPDPLPRWYASYEGHGDGQVTRDAFAEPYVGDLRGTPRIVILGLNPGRACLDFQGRDGIFACEIRERGSYSAWAATFPYLGEEWSRVNGRNRYAWSRLHFAREWLQDQELAADRLLTLELYPWHSTRVTARIAPPAEIIETFVWQPLADIPVEIVFAFGKPWLRVCDALGLPEVGRWGRGGVDLGSPVASRAAVAFALPSGQWVVVSWQSGYAGPPGREDALRLRELVLEARDDMRDSRPDPQGLSATPRRHRRNYTASQAKNRMRRTVKEILDPGPRNVDALWEHFDAQCAYCGKGLSRDWREGHIDHADPDGGNDLGNLILACASCNGDEKREESWHEFLRRKTPNDALFAEREGRIRAWLNQHPRRSTEDSPEIAHVREELEGLIEQFAVKCAELKRLVSQRDSAP
jgi:5-methylcytosine-specific restriction endonuclease McrA